MKKLYLFILFFLPSFLIAQSNYKSGYVVNIKGDTLHGYIDYKEWDFNPKSINFIKNQGGKAQRLGISDINYFEINDYVSYQRYTVSISKNGVDIASPSSIADTASKTDTVFLKILEKGKNVTLYVYKDALKERFYIKDNDSGCPGELLYGIYEDPNSADKVITKSTYRLQLSQLVIKYNQFSDKLIQKVQQSNYKEYELIPIAVEINGKIQAHESSKKADASGLRFFIGGSVLTSNLKAGQYYSSPTSSSTSPKINAGLDLVVNPAVGHLVFRIELGYAVNNFSFTNIIDPVYNVANPESTKIKVKQNEVFFTPQVLYNIFNKNSLKVFLNLGYALNFLSYPDNQGTTFKNGKPVSPGTTNVVLDSQGDYTAFQLKAGVVLVKRFEIYAAYLQYAVISNYADYSNTLSSYQFGINYLFGKAVR